MLNFPNNPPLNTEHTIGVKTWQWNGYAWDLMSISEAQVKRAEDAAAIALEAAQEATGGSITLFQTKGDKVSDTIIYKGESLPNNAENSLSWRIRKLTINYSNPISIKTEWPNGLQNFRNSWADRLSYTYI